jgi:hypothetical protein
MKTIIIDTETYPNFFLLAFMELESGKVASVRLTADTPLNDKRVRGNMAAGCTIGYNSLAYDLPMICAALGGFDNAALKGLSDKLIKSKQPWNVTRAADIVVPDSWDHIDIMGIAPGQASLKAYAGRLDAPTLQDLPYEPDTVLTPEQMDEVERYCVNDLRLTALLYQHLKPQIDLRVAMSKQYGIDLRSKGDAQIAEAVLTHELRSAGVVVERPKYPASYTFKYTPPKWIRFNSPELSAVLQAAREAEFTLDADGAVVMPDSLGQSIEFCGPKYTIGIGGLHSSEESQAISLGEGEYLSDFDVVSYYPSIILGEKYYPEHLGPKFLPVYRSIVERRLTAKREKDMVTADSLKITINSSFGKFGNKYSNLYSPRLLIQVTLTGQLALLMLIEMIEVTGACVVSANTDGIVVYSASEAVLDLARGAVADFEIISGYDMEETQYSALYAESVNNYIAVKHDGTCKSKGAYAKTGISKNPAAPICSEAVRRYLVDDVDLAETIGDCQDILQFCTVRRVTGGAVWRGTPLGNTVRWYIGNDVMAEPVRYAKNGNKVPKSDCAIPLMTVPDEFPVNVNRHHYLHEAEKMLKRLGVKYA